MKARLLSVLLIICLSLCACSAGNASSTAAQAGSLPIHDIPLGSIPEGPESSGAETASPKIDPVLPMEPEGSSGESLSTEESAASSAEPASETAAPASSEAETEVLTSAAETEPGSFTSTEAQTEPRKPLRILCFGDSNTYGLTPQLTQLPQEQIWTSLLQEKLGFDRAEVIREGLTGRTTAYDRPGAPWKNGLTALPEILEKHAPLDMVLIMLGGNDCLAEMHLSAEQIAEGMKMLIGTTRSRCRSLQGFEPQILIIVPPGFLPEYVNTPSAQELDQHSLDTAKALGPLYRKLAEAEGCLFYDAYGKLEISPLDCEHMTPTGHSELAEELFLLLDPLVP